MRTNYYDLYVKSVFALAKTIVIKSAYSASMLNTYCDVKHGPGTYDSNNPWTWKYYLNISGEYHPTDTQMTISSLDTAQDIAFNKNNLSAHPLTKAAYEYDSRYYRELVLQYPDQEQLILGIIYPVDIDDAIAAKDFTVLGYPSDLIEAPEVSLVPKINEWLDHFNIRWNVPAFQITDEYYGSALLGVMYAQLVPLIINLRLRACKTNEAHSYHVREYLASHCFIDVYLNQLNWFQALFFYRNIRYIQRNNGKADTFEWLMEKIMTVRGLPLSEYSMKHDISEMPSKLQPTVSFRRRLMNTTVQAMDALDNYASFDTVLAKEQPLDKGNPDFIKFNRDNIRKAFELSKSSTVATKMVISSVVDYTDAVPYTLHEALLNHWQYFSQKDLYTATLTVVNPRSGDTFKISAKNAYIYFIYAFARSIGITLTKVPPVAVRRVQRVPKPTVNDLMKVVSTKYVTREDAAFVLSLNPTIGAMGTVDQFKTAIEAIHYASWKQGNFIAYQEHEFTRAQVHAMVNMVYMDEFIEPDDYEKPYEQWFQENRLDYQNLSDENWHELMLNLYQQATGYNMNVTQNVSELQKAMVQLFAQLSSYSIQFITDINKTSVKVVNWAAIRVGDFKGAGKAFYEIQLHIMKIFRHRWKAAPKYQIEFGPLEVDLIGALLGPDLGHLELPFQITRSKKHSKLGTLDLGPGPLLSNLWSGNFNLRDVPSMAGWFALTKQEQDEYEVLLGCKQVPFYPEKVDMDDLVLRSNVPGFEFIQVKRTYMNAFTYFYVPKFSYKFLNLNTETELDAFYNNYGNMAPPVSFEYNGGNTMIKGINLMANVPLDTNANAFDYSGGWQYSLKFDPALGLDTETTLAEFINVTSVTEIDLFVPKYSETSTDAFDSSLAATSSDPFAFKSTTTQIIPLTSMYSETGILTAKMTSTYSFGFFRNVSHRSNNVLTTRYSETKFASEFTVIKGPADVGFTGLVRQIDQSIYPMFSRTTLGNLYGIIGKRARDIDPLIAQYSVTQIESFKSLTKHSSLPNFTVKYVTTQLAISNAFASSYDFVFTNSLSTVEILLEL